MKKPAKLKVKKGKDLIQVSASTIKSILAGVGYTGQLLLKGTDQVYHEATKMAKSGILHVADFEKALVKGVKNTNDIAINTAKKITKQVLK